jgi:phage terminase small subunit
MRNESKLTNKQKMFCKEYIVDLNASQACIRAGYSEKTAKEIGCENLTKLNIQEEITRLMKSREERVQLTADKVLEDIERVRGLAEGSEQYSISLKASELQGKHLAMFTDKQQIDGEVMMPIVNVRLKRD